MGRRFAGLTRLLASALSFTALSARGKLLDGSFDLSPTSQNDRVHYVTKFACSIGECQYRTRAALHHYTWGGFRFNSNPRPENITAKAVVRIVLDEEWETSHDLSACDRAALGRGRTTLHIPLNGEWGPWATNTFRQTYRPHFWYFFIEDCKNTLLEATGKALPANTSLVGYSVKYEMEVIQVGGSHLSYEHLGMRKWHFIQLLSLGGLLFWMIRKQTKAMKTQRFQLHIMTQMLNASVIVSMLGSVFHLWHLHGINSTGKPSMLREALADGCSTVSQVVVGSCLIMISLGVTLNAPDRYPVPLVLALGVAIATAHFVVILTDKLTSDPKHKYYGSEGSVGVVLLVFRLALWVIWLLCWHGTRIDSRTPPATERFLRRTILPASAYFLTFPIILLLTALCKPYWRHAVFFHCTFLLNAVSIFWLAEVFLSKGEYFKVSTMSRSFLPGGVWRPTITGHHVE